MNKRSFELTLDEVLLLHGELVANPFYVEGENPTKDNLLTQFERAGTEMIYEDYEAEKQLRIPTETPEIVTVYVLASRWLYHELERINAGKEPIKRMHQWLGICWCGGSHSADEVYKLNSSVCNGGVCECGGNLDCPRCYPIPTRRREVTDAVSRLDVGEWEDDNKGKD